MQEKRKIKTSIITELANLRKRVAKLERLKVENEERQKLLHNETVYSSLVEYSQDAIYILFKGKFDYINRKFSELFQVTLEEVNSPEFDFFSLVAPESRNIIEKRIRKIAEGEVVEPKYEFTALTKGGERLDVEASVSYIPYKGDTAAHGILRDITERKKMEKALRESEERYRLHFENVSDIIFSIDPEFKLLSVSPSVERVLGYRPEELVCRKVDELGIVPPDCLAISLSDIQRVLAGERINSSKYTFVAKDGTKRCFEISSAPVFLNNQVVALISVARDITDRLLTEEELKVREKELSIKSHNLEEVNTALKVLLNRREEDSAEFEKRVVSNVQKLISPYVKKLKNSGLKYDQMTYLDIIEGNLNDITSPFLRKLSAKYINFTPQEIQVSNLIKEGQKNKVIAEILNISERTVAFHRENIRKKLEITNKKTNLRSYILSIS